MFIFYILLQIIFTLSVAAGTSPRSKTLTGFRLVTPGYCGAPCSQTTRIIKGCAVEGYSDPRCEDLCENTKIDKAITCFNCIYTTTSACRDVPYKDWDEMYEAIAGWKDYCTRRTSYEANTTVQWEQWAPYNHTAAVNSTSGIDCATVPARRLMSAASRRVQFGSKFWTSLCAGLGLVTASFLL